MTEIKVGDLVLWRNSDHPNALGIANCRVINFGTAENGEPAATIFIALGNGEKVNAYLKDLHKD